MTIIKSAAIIALTLLVLVSLPADAGPAGPEEQTPPLAEQISLLVGQECGRQLEGTDKSHDAEVRQAFARCLLDALDGADPLGMLSDRCGPSAWIGDRNTLECMADRLVAEQAAGQFWAIAEACGYVDPSMRPLCGEAGTAAFLDDACGLDTRLCQAVVITVEHESITMEDRCEGTLTLEDEIQQWRWTSRFPGSLQIMELEVTDSMRPEKTMTFSYDCLTWTNFTGSGSGGFMRQVEMRSSVEGGAILCTYDGVMETGCNGTASYREGKGFDGYYEAVNGSGMHPATEFLLTYDGNWSVYNYGQGSTRAFQTADPEPVPIPAQAWALQVDYTTVDNRTQQSATAVEAPGPAVLPAAAILAAVAVLWRHRRRW